MRLLCQLTVHLCLILGLLTPTWGQERNPPIKPLVVGLMPYLTTRTLLANYQPIAQALENELHQPVQLLTAPDFDTFVKRVFDGEYDLALLAPHYARLASKDYGYTPLLVHKSPIRGVLVTASTRPLLNFNELRGQDIAVVDRSALIAIAAVASLAEEGLREHFDYRFVETVSHSSALYNAINGKARAALVSYSTLLLSPPELQQETIIWKDLANIPGQFYIAHSRLPQVRQQAIKGALLAFEKSKEGRAFFEKTRHGGLREPSAEDYAQIDRILPETRKQLGALLR